MAMNNPFDDILNNVSFSKAPVSPFDNVTVTKVETQKEEKPVEEKPADNVIKMTFDEPKQEESQETVQEEQPVVEEKESEPIKEETASEPEKPKKRKRRTKAEMEEAKRKAAEEESAEKEADTSDEEKEEQEQAEPQPVAKEVEHKQETVKVEEDMQFSEASNDYDKVDMEVVKEYMVPNPDDPEWDAQVEYIEGELAKLKKFDSEINEGSIRIMIPLYTNLGMYVAPIKGQYDALAEALNNKETGIIAQQKAMNAVGSNEAERRRNSYKACTVYKAKGMKEPINLFDYSALITYRTKYLAGVVYNIEIAKSSLIGFLTVLSKIEK